jgi:hypothetical protein
VNVAPRIQEGERESRRLRSLIFLSWGLGASAVALAGWLEDPFLTQVHGLSPPQPYPLFAVTLTLLFMAIEVLVLAAILRPRSYRHAWGRAALALVVSVAGVRWASLPMAHKPPLWDCYFIWTIAVTAALFSLLVVSGHAASRRNLQHNGT